MFPQKTAGSCDARVPWRRQRPAPRAIGEHAPEFDQAKLSKAFTNADLRIQDWATIIEHDHQGDYRKDRTQNSEPRQRANDVKRAPKDLLPHKDDGSLISALGHGNILRSVTGFFMAIPVQLDGD